MKKAIFWFRRDLRVLDNRGLAFATQNYERVYPIFIFDEAILKHLDKNDHRLAFIWDQLVQLQKKIPLTILFGKPQDLIPELARKHSIDCVIANEDYQQFAMKRDKEIAKKVNLNLMQDHVLCRFDHVLKTDGTPYKVYTPYKNAWLQQFEKGLVHLKQYKSKLTKLTQLKEKTIESLEQFGFEYQHLDYAFEKDANKVLKAFEQSIESYKDNRDYPELEATSRLSVHLRFGTLSVREIARRLREKELIHSTWFSQLIWRDFYFAIISHFKHAEVKEFNLKYQNINWSKEKKVFNLWKNGKTGFPLVDAGMRELNQTGFMHNRVRMVVASFLTKNLFIDWKWGERYFAQRLYDYDLALNNGNWQWASSTGVDAQPYFRVFNPKSQSKKFDSQAEYIKKWCPELKEIPAKFIHDLTKLKPLDQELYGCVLGKDYPEEMIDLSESRLNAIAIFKNH